MSNYQQVQGTTPLYLDESATARAFGFSIPWLRKRRRLGLPPTFYRVGRMIRYSHKDVQRFLTAQKVEPEREQ